VARIMIDQSVTRSSNDCGILGLWTGVQIGSRLIFDDLVTSRPYLWLSVRGMSLRSLIAVS
jgi:hypothetical protein